MTKVIFFFNYRNLRLSCESETTINILLIFSSSETILIILDTGGDIFNYLPGLLATVTKIINGRTITNQLQ